MRLLKILPILILISIFVIIAMFVSIRAIAQEASTTIPQILTYFESSAGLTPPQMEGSRTEIEMADVNADGFLDLISIGDHGSPYIGTGQHGIMVWFGDGTGNWEVFQNGDGWADFAVTHQHGVVFIGDGAGGFSAADGDLPDPGGWSLAWEQDDQVVRMSHLPFTYNTQVTLTVL